MVRQRRGFTLIELLVVIAIIGILSAVVLASMSGARSKGRDAKRVADLKQLQLAVQLFYDGNDSYPSASGNVGTVSLTALVPNYLSVLPSEPLSGRHYVYLALPAAPVACISTACIDYVLAVELENKPTGLDPYRGDQAVTVNTNSHNCNEAYPAAPPYIYCVKP